MTAIDKSKQGELDYPNAIDVANDRALQFFAYYLQGAKNGYPLLPPVQYYQLGTNEWRMTNDWYSLGSKIDTMYLGNNKALKFSAPQSITSFDSLHYDPRDPSPAIGGSRFNPFDKTILMGPVDIRQQVESRSDALIFSTEPLSSDLILTGPVSVELFISSNRKDTDFSVRLCDVYPDGRSIIITQGIRRARFRNTYNKEELMNPGQIYPITIDLQNIALTILKDHRLRIVVSSSDYPHFDINLNNGDALYKPGDTLIATNYIYHDASHPSRLTIVNSSTTHVNEQKASQPKQMSLEQNYPNPFSKITNIHFRFSNVNHAKMRFIVYDALGREVATLFDQECEAGDYSIPFDARNLKAGIYFYRLEMNQEILSKTFVLLK